MAPLRLDDVRTALPELDELRPLLDHLVRSSIPDPSRKWAASDELDTMAGRLVATGDWRSAARELAERERGHLELLYGAVFRAVESSERGDGAGAIGALLEAAALEERRNRPSRAEIYAERACEAARREGDPRLLALALRRHGRAARAMGRLPEAERLYASGHRLARDAGDAGGAAEGAIGAGNVLEQQGRWTEAAKWYQTALDLLAALPGRRPEHWHASLNLHVVMRSLGQIDESVTWLRRAEEVIAELRDEAAAPLVHNAWGQLHMARREIPEAVARFREALAAPGGAWARVNFRLNLAEALLATGLLLDATEEAREAEQEALAAGIPGKLPEVYRLLGRIAASRGNADAFVLFERALEIIRERRLPPIEEAVTLQAYAQAIQPVDPERAQDLEERAAVAYRELRLPGERDPWSESYGVVDATARDTPAGPQGLLSESGGNEP